MIFKIVNKLFVVLFLFAFLTTVAQNQKKKTPQPSPLQKEYLAATRQLQSIQDKARKDSELIKESELLKKQITEEMINNDPSVKQLIEKQKDLEKQFFAAEKEDHKEKMIEIQTEYKDVTDKIMVHQNEALEKPSLKAKTEAFDKKFMAKMKEINPDVQQLIDRINELRTQLSQAQN